MVPRSPAALDATPRPRLRGRRRPRSAPPSPYLSSARHVGTRLVCRTAEHAAARSRRRATTGATCPASNYHGRAENPPRSETTTTSSHRADLVGIAVPSKGITQRSPSSTPQGTRRPRRRRLAGQGPRPARRHARRRYKLDRAFGPRARGLRRAARRTRARWSSTGAGLVCASR